MQVQDVMVRAVKALRPDTNLQEAASLMCLQRFTVLPVADEENKLLGVLAERDILSFLFPDIKELMESIGSVNFEELEKDYKKIFNMKVSDLMHKNVISVQPSFPILKAVSLMARNNFRRVPVTENGKLVGIISLGDIHRAIFMESFSSH